jgi:predicted nucleic acid-binding protein
LDIVFLDASVLFSAAYRSKAMVFRIWELGHVRLVTSSYAVEETHKNLADSAQKDRLAELLKSVNLLGDVAVVPLPAGIDLPAKDIPILQAAVAARATHLLTSDMKHFGRYFWQMIEGVLILPPGAYLKLQRR